MAALKKKKKFRFLGCCCLDLAHLHAVAAAAAKLGQAVVASATCSSCGGPVVSQVHGGQLSSKNGRRANRERRALVTQAAARAAKPIKRSAAAASFPRNCSFSYRNTQERRHEGGKIGIFQLSRMNKKDKEEGRKTTIKKNIYI